jgi:uncharacterized membrane protein YkvA (DUF1232 family)
MSDPISDVLHRLRIDAHAMWLAARDPRTPPLARFIGIIVAAYALSPIDLIPDFIPVLGLLDDVIILPLGLWIFVKLIPPELFSEHRATAEIASHRPVSRKGAVAIVIIWIAAVALLAFYIWSWRYW